MIKLIFLLILQFSTQYELYNNGKKAGNISVYKNIVYVNLDGESVEEFELMFKQLTNPGITYYIKSNKAEGYIAVFSYQITVYLVTTGIKKHRYEHRFDRLKRVFR